MRGRMLLAGVGLFSSLLPGFSQFPPPRELPKAAPFRPLAPMPQPPAARPSMPALPDGSVLPLPRAETPLPKAEDKFPVDPAVLTAKKVNGVWQIWGGSQAIRTVGPDEIGAKDVVRLLQDQKPTEWASIGSPRPVVEYGLVNGRPPVHNGLPRGVIPIDLRTVRLDPIKGVWCVCDDSNILFNFGLNKADAEQAVAVIRRYGFNRIGLLGDVTSPAMTYFFVAVEPDGAKPPARNPLAVAFQEQNLARTGIAVPGVGYFGEMLKIEWRKAEVRREGSDWVVANGSEVIGRFGQDQSAARDALRVIQDGQFSELGRPGPPGILFFLANGQAPNRVPLFVQGRRFDAAGLKVMNYGTRWALTDRGRHLLDLNSAEEGEAMIKLIKFYNFDQICHVGNSARDRMTFLSRGGR